jgi:putative SOS response-associated peptidase YedK
MPHLFGGNAASEHASKNQTFDALKKSDRCLSFQRGFRRFLAGLKRKNSRCRTFFYLDHRGPVEFAFDST